MLGAEFRTLGSVATGGGKQPTFRGHSARCAPPQTRYRIKLGSGSSTIIPIVKVGQEQKITLFRIAQHGQDLGKVFSHNRGGRAFNGGGGEGSIQPYG